MTVTSTQARYSHHISDDEVLQAPSLAKNGQQRLYSIVDGEVNVFFFNIYLDQGCTASVEFYIAPVVCDLAHHTLYAVTGSYTLSHDNMHVDQVLQPAQLIYDTYIRVTCLRLNNDILKYRPSTLFSPSAFPNLPPSNAADRIIPHIPTYSMSLEKSRKRRRNSDRAISSSDVEVDGKGITASGSGRSARNASNQNQDPKTKPEQVAGILIKAIKRGQEKIKRREMKHAQETNYNHAVFCYSIPNNGKSFDDYLDQIQRTLSSTTNSDNSNNNRKTWTNWFFLSCLQLVRENNRGGRKHLPLKGAKLVNLIVDKLFISDGITAMGVYNALAENDYRLRRASEVSSRHMEYISDLVAKDLHGQIHHPAHSSQIPFPAFWLSTLFPTVQYHEICDNIGLSQLASLRFQPENELLMGVEMSLMEEKIKSKNAALQDICDQVKLDQPSPIIENCSGDPAYGTHGRNTVQSGLPKIFMVFKDERYVYDLGYILSKMRWQ